MAATVPNGPKRIRRRGGRRHLLAGAVQAVVWIGAIVAIVWLHGRVESGGTLIGYGEDRSVTLAHLENGVVRDVHVQLHEDVRSGQILVQMDDRQERIRFAAIQKDIERLRADVAAERAGLAADNARAGSAVDDLSRRFLLDREATHVDYLAQLMEDARDRVLLRGSLVEYDIVRDLHDRGHAPFRELNDVRTEADALKEQIERNESVLARKKTAFEDADVRWFQFALRDPVAAEYDPILTPIRLAADVRAKDLEEVVRLIDDHVLRSPIQGQITALFAEVGDPVLAGEALAAVSPTQTRRIVAYLPERMANAARVGDMVTVQPVAMAAGGTLSYSATVVSLSTIVSEAPVRYRTMPNWPVWGQAVVVALPEDNQLMPGQAARIRFDGPAGAQQ
ncbi:MAG: HlyD family efflux transporter periplasmic adaptor subunit [Phycisphaerae bacterium]